MVLRKARSLKNTLLFYTPWERARNAAFALAGLALLFGLYAGFVRLVEYLATVELIGRLIIWKLTAMLFLMTFSMVTISSLLTSLTTLYYSFDLRFLAYVPVPHRAVFAEKALESVFFASWMIGLILLPYAGALTRVFGWGAGFMGGFVLVLPPFLLLAASGGLLFTLVLLCLFPSSRTRDVIWVLASLSLTMAYGLIRFAEPERLIRPDALKIVAQYLAYLQAPTAPYLPSWWLTKAIQDLAAGRVWEYWRWAALLYAAAAAAYGFLVWLSGPLYFQGVSGAQEGRLRRLAHSFVPFPEGALGLSRQTAALLWKERSTFFRDVKHWSQILLVVGLVFVYLFSVSRLPLDNEDLRLLVSFLNIGTAGFVIAALGLRFTYPSVSLEGRAWWALRSSPVTVAAVMRQKLLFSAVPFTLLALVLGLVTNHFLDADRFTAVLSVGALLVCAWGICAMGVGFGALFPLFTVENIHQIESSLGGFVYMACSLFYIGATVMILSWPMQMHFQERFGKVGAWNWGTAAVCLALWVFLNALAFAVPWRLGLVALERHEA